MSEENTTIQTKESNQEASSNSDFWPMLIAINAGYILIVIALIYYWKWIDWNNPGIYIFLIFGDMIVFILNYIRQTKYTTVKKEKEVILLEPHECDDVIQKRMLERKHIKVVKGVGLEAFEIDGFYGRDAQNKSPIYQSIWRDNSKKASYWIGFRQDNKKMAIIPDHKNNKDAIELALKALTDDPILETVREETHYDSLGNPITRRVSNPWKENNEIPKEIPALD